MKEEELNNYSELLKACRNNNLDLVKELITKENINGLANTKNLHRRFNHPPLEMAIQSRNYKIMEYLLYRGANPNLLFDGDITIEYEVPLGKRTRGIYFLHFTIDIETETYAFENPYLSNKEFSETIPIQSLEILVKYGAKVNVINGKGDTPIDTANQIYNNSAENYLRKLGGKTAEELGQTPLYIGKKDQFLSLLKACEKGEFELVKKCLEKDLINGFSKIPYSNPLLRSIVYSKYDIVEFLLKNGANPNFMFNGGGIGKVEYIMLPERILNGTYSLHCNIEVEAIRYKNKLESPYPHKIEYYEKLGISTDITELLIEYGADINIQNEKGDAPLDIAIGYNNFAAEKILRNLGAKTSKELEEENKS